MLLWIQLALLVCVSARALGEPVAPLLNDPDEWADVDDESQIGKAVVMIPADPEFMSKFKGVKHFVKNDLAYYHAVELKIIMEDRTELRLYNLQGQVQDNFDLHDWDADEIEDILLDYGFFKRKSLDDEVPEIYVNGTHPEGYYDEDHDEL